MMNKTQDTDRLEERREALRQALSTLGDLRPGSLTPRYRRCGKPNCHCAGKGARGHGPSWSLTRKVQGKTKTTVIPAEAVAQTKAQLAEYRRLRALTQELVEVSETLCEAQLAAEHRSAGKPAKKGASKKTSTEPSALKSKRS